MLVRHGGCTVKSEIISLLEKGYPDGKSENASQTARSESGFRDGGNIRRQLESGQNYRQIDIQDQPENRPGGDEPGCDRA
jgi:hypothetical protein